MQAQVKAFFDPATWTVSYVVFDAPGGHCALVDSVLDYDPKSGRTRTDSANQLIAFVREQNLTVDWILETHAHADHLSAAPYLRKHLGGKIAIGGKIKWHSVGWRLPLEGFMRSAHWTGPVDFQAESPIDSSRNAPALSRLKSQNK